MKKKFIFTEESSFSHMKDKMHNSVTEHIVEDDETKKLYHYVVSYGSWFKISYQSVFMSHLLKKIGVTGFGVGYIADDCKIELPWYPQYKIEKKSVVELPDFIKLEDVEFGDKKEVVSDKYKQSFVGKTFVKEYEGGKAYTITGEELLPYLFGCSCFRYGTALFEDKAYPLHCLLQGGTWHKMKDLRKMLEETEIIKQSEIQEVLKKFIELEIEKEIAKFTEETSIELPDLKVDLIERQEIVKKLLYSHELDVEK